ncbi:MAG: alpha/beta fold hydrolase [Anaerolineae bacterium]|nr:alpha/beta fold hydrolase [Anaerolineae bacterium]
MNAQPRRSPRAAVSGLLVLAALLIATLFAACGTESGGAPTGTPQPALPILAASPTTDPRPPIAEGAAIHDPGYGEAGVSNPTQASLAAEGQLAQDPPTITPRPTQAELPMMISAADGLVLQATYYSASSRPAPAALLLHQRGRDRTTWDALALRLQAAGYAVLAVDQRGHGATGGAEDWALAQQDAHDALAMLSELPGIAPGQIIVIGASIGANLGLNACAGLPGCAAAVLLSPGLDYRGITTAGAMAQLGARPLLIVASEGDGNNPADSITLDSMAAGDHQVIILPDAGHGTAMLLKAPDLAERIVAWLVARVPPPGQPLP